MKKTLAAVAVLGAFAGSAFAADVTLYGIVDMGLQYSHVDVDGLNGADDVDKFSMESGLQSTSRWGLKGTEDLGNGLTVGFILEDGFSADSGAESGVMFDRESTLFLEGGFGKVAMGRIGTFNQGQGSWSLIGRITPFGTSWGSYTAQAGTAFAAGTRYDNAIAYQTPSFAGFKVYAMYGMGDDGTENESGSNRYYGIAATYDNGPFSAYLAVDSINYASWYDSSAHDTDDSLTVTLGGSYNFDVAKVYLGAQYFSEVRLSALSGVINNSGSSVATLSKAVNYDNAQVTGYSVLLGADAPVAGGKLMFAAAYMDAEQGDAMEDAGEEFDFTRWIVSLGYDYPLSKRTNVYAVASYIDDEIENKKGSAAQDWNPSAYTFMIGMRHRF